MQLAQIAYGRTEDLLIVVTAGRLGAGTIEEVIVVVDGERPPSEIGHALHKSPRVRFIHVLHSMMVELNK